MKILYKYGNKEFNEVFVLSQITLEGIRVLWIPTQPYKTLKIRTNNVNLLIKRQNTVYEVFVINKRLKDWNKGV